MALYATNRFAGDGTTTQYEINFVGQYIDRSHVKAYRVDNATQVRTPVVIAPGQWLNATTITGFAPTPVGQTLVIYRDTPKPPMVDFVNGSRLTEYNLDLVARQGLFVAMEALDSNDPEAIDELLAAIEVVVGLVNQATADVADATAAALAAAGSAADALGYRNAAQAAQTAAETARNAAQASAGNAATSATNAANLASAAASSAAAAETSKSNAAASAATATTQAGLAGGYSVSANNSANNAAMSATTALNAKTAAENAATSAGQSQTAAAASAALAASYALVDVRALGAVGDGVADDTAAFNSAPSGVMHIPAGTYRLAGWVPKSNTTYLLSSGATLTQANNGASIVALANGAKNITFMGGTFRGLATSSAGAISIFDTQGAAYRNDLRVDSCTFDNFGGSALVLGGAKGWSVSGCIFRKTAQLNIPSGGTSYPAIWCSDSQAPSSYDQSSDGLIEGCVFEDMYWSGVYALGLRISIRNSQFRNTRESAIFISHFAERISVTGCSIDGTTMHNISASGVEVGGDHVVVSGNRITNCGASGVSIQDARFFNVTSNLLASNQTGIAIISSSASRPPSYGVVKANMVTNSTKHGIWLFTIAGVGGPFGPGDYSGNSVTGSGEYNFYISPPAVVPNDVLISYNTPLDSGPQAVNVNVVGLSVGTGRLIASFNFRPRQLSCIGGNPGPAARFSVGTCEVLPGGGVAQACQGFGDTGQTIEAALVSIASVFKASVTDVNWNPTTAKWDVFGQVHVNAGVSVFLTITATP